MGLQGWSRRHAMALVGVGISAVLLVVVFARVEWAEMARALGQTRWGFLVLGALVGMGGFLVRALDWKFLLRPVARVSALRLFPPVAIGYMANNIFPARLGELVRAYVVGKREGVSKSSALATIVVERILDGLTLLLILAAVSLFFPFPRQVKVAGWFVAAVFVGLALALALVAVKVEWGMRLLEGTACRLSPALGEKLKSWLRCFVVGLDLTGHPWSALAAFAACVGRWAFEACIYFGVALAMPQLGIPPHGVLFVMVVVNILTMVPSAPGYVGTVQAACVLALGVFGLSESDAVAYSLLLHAAIYFPITLTGVAFVVALNIKVSAAREGEGAVGAQALGEGGTCS